MFFSIKFGKRYAPLTDWNAVTIDFMEGSDPNIQTDLHGLVYLQEYEIAIPEWYVSLHEVEQLDYAYGMHKQLQVKMFKVKQQLLNHPDTISVCFIGTIFIFSTIFYLCFNIYRIIING